jgi:hypothetical protein
MGLICYWQRRNLVRRLILGEPILPGSSLAKHLRACEQCAQARRDYTDLQEILPAVSDQTGLSDDFGVRLRARLQREREALPQFALVIPSAPGHRGSRLLLRSLVTAAVALAVAAVWLPRLGNHRPASAREASPGKMILGYGRDEPSLEAPMASRNGSSPWKLPARTDNRFRTVRYTLRAYSLNESRRHRHSWRQARQIRRGRFGVSPYREYARIRNSDAFHQRVGKLPAPGLALDHGERAVPVIQVSFFMPAWDGMGEVYEALGDHGSASQVYGRAFDRQPDADLAIAASENAESAGDISEALEYCAKALR